MATPRLTKQMISQEIARINTALPCVATNYNSSNQSVNIHIIPAFRKHAADGTLEIYQAGVEISNVPVSFFGTGDMSITADIQDGTTGLAVFADRSMDEWKHEGGSDSEPQDTRRHDLKDAVFIPALSPFKDPLPSSAVASGAIVIRGGDVRLGSANAIQHVALGDIVDAVLEQLGIIFDTWVPIPLDGGGALKILLTALRVTGWPASTKSAKVKAE